MFKIRIFLVLSLFVPALNGAIGCRHHSEHTPDHWNVSKQNYQSCSCPCRNTIDERGYCTKCGHYGLHDRGAITALVLDELGISLF